MDKEKEEYISLRQEVIDLCSASDRIIHILYLFLASYLVFGLEKEDTIYILSIHIIILPLYLLAIDRRIASCKISAYISVFHEKEGNKWETRLMEYTTLREPTIFKYVSSKHFSFIFANCLGLIVFIYKTTQNFSMSIYEIAKIILEVILFFSIIIIFMNHKKIQVCDYIEEWEKVKENEDKESKEKYMNFINNMPEKVKQEISEEILQKKNINT